MPGGEGGGVSGSWTARPGGARLRAVRGLAGGAGADWDRVEVGKGEPGISTMYSSRLGGAKLLGGRQRQRKA